jgi:hypothetical protein
VTFAGEKIACDGALPAGSRQGELGHTDAFVTRATEDTTLSDCRVDCESLCWVFFRLVAALCYAHR